MNKSVEALVIGGGHAGIEAALALARLGHSTILISLSIENIGKMPCNPSIGGPAKGIVVREIDALGGQMGRTADATALQFKMLNTTKGPGVWSLRVQSDKLAYKKMMQDVLLSTPHLEVVEGQVVHLDVENQQVLGVTLQDGSIYRSQVTVLTTGTYMASLIMRGHTATPGGPDQEPTTEALSESLREAGLELFRLKTGTPPRILQTSIDFSQAQLEPGTEGDFCFSEETQTILPLDKQVPCHLIYTTSETHQIIRDNLEKSAMYSGLVKGVGPRYCPSIEDKLVKFADKPRHQLFLEPESLSLPTTYIQGFSTSMPEEVQEKMVRSLPGMKQAEFVKYAYAIEYDAINPLQCSLTLENKVVANLFTAGQINGTSGYEEAAGQGLLAGINAARKLEGKDPIILRRDEAYIGVMVDDLCTKGTLEPYRLLTSRAEYRLLMRHDNADQRLCALGHEVGLVSDKRYQSYLKKMEQIKEAKIDLEKTKLKIDQINPYLVSLGYEPLTESCSAYQLLARPHVTVEGLNPFLNKPLDSKIGNQVAIEIKYAGYIEKAKREANRMHKMDRTLLPKNTDYSLVPNLSLEARQKLNQTQPTTIGQASRISGINPADIQMLAIWLERKDSYGN